MKNDIVDMSILIPSAFAAAQVQNKVISTARPQIRTFIRLVWRQARRFVISAMKIRSISQFVALQI